MMLILQCCNGAETAAKESLVEDRHDLSWEHVINELEEKVAAADCCLQRLPESKTSTMVHVPWPSSMEIQWFR